MIRFIDEHKAEYGIESICNELPIAVSTYHDNKARQPSARELSDAELLPEVQRVWESNYRVYGRRKVWAQLNREGIQIGRDRCERLMKQAGIAGVVRGRKPRTTIADTKAPRAPDLVDRDWNVDAPNRVWVTDFTYVRTWQKMVYVAFVIDVYSRRIVGWRVDTSMKTELVLDALEQAIWSRNERLDGLIAHSDAGSQYTSISYTERLAEIGAAPSIGSVGDPIDNAVAESTIGLYKTELINPQRPWRTVDEVEFATFEYVDWFNNRRLHSEIGNVTPVEAETQFYDQQPAPTQGPNSAVRTL
jgi:transposase InsO family protein